MRVAIQDELIRLSSFPLTMVTELQQARVIANYIIYNYPKHTLLKISHKKKKRQKQQYKQNISTFQHFTDKRQHCKTTVVNILHIAFS